MIRIGANPIGWTNDDLQHIGGDTPLETCLAEAREAGIVGMEKGHKMPSDGAALKAKLAEFGHVFVGGWYSTELLKRSVADEVEAARAHVAMTKGAGAEVMILAETSNAIHGDRAKRLSERPRLTKTEWAAFGAKLTEFASRLADQGLKPCYHHHMGTVVQSEADIDCLMANTKPPFQLLLDTGHARWGGADPAGLARTYRERIGHVHCKDVREMQMRQSHAGDWSFLDSILGVGDDLGRLHRARRRRGRLRRVVPGTEGLFRLGGAGSRAGPEEGASARLRQTGNSPSPGDACRGGARLGLVDRRRGVDHRQRRQQQFVERPDRHDHDQREQQQAQKSSRPPTRAPAVKAAAGGE